MFRLAVILLALTGPAHAVGSVSAPEGVSLEGVETAIAAQDYVSADDQLQAILQDTPNDADALNLKGYVARKTGDFEAAAEWYARALVQDPNHLGALEYQGELFLQQGNRDAAEVNLARLKVLCGRCEAYEDLEQAVAASQ